MLKSFAIGAAVGMRPKRHRGGPRQKCSGHI